MSNLSDLYEKAIMEHARRPHNSYEMTDASHSAKGVNRLCGDKVDVFLKLSGDRIDEVSAVAKGCAISKASASIMTEAFKGKTVDYFHEQFKALRDVLADEGDIEQLDDAAALSGVKKFPVRIKCATLAWFAMESAIVNNNDEVVSIRDSEEIIDIHQEIKKMKLFIDDIEKD